MKKTNFFYCIITILLLQFIIFSCSKESTNDLDNNEIKYTMNVLGEDISYISYSGPDTGEAEYLSSVDLIVEKEELLKISRKINENIKFNDNILSDESVVGVILYLNGDYHSTETEDLMGLSVLSSSVHSINHSYSKIQNGIGELDERFNSKVNKYFSRNFKALLVNSETQENNQATFLVIRTPSYFEKMSKRKKVQDSFSKSIIDNLPLKFTTKDQAVTRGPDPGHAPDCGSPCVKDPGSCVENPDTGEGVCEGCARNNIDPNLASVDLDVVFPLKSAYEFRDNFLASYAIGNQYIAYYYEISYVMSALNTINSSNITEHVQLGIELYNIADKLQNGASSDIIITSSFKNEVNLLIDYYYNLTSNNDFKEILDNIKADLNTFEGKTRSQVLSEI